LGDDRIRSVKYGVTRFTVDTGETAQRFRVRYQVAVPRLPTEDVKALVSRQAAWPEMVSLIDAAAPFGFLIYGVTDVDPVMRLAGDTGSCVSYLMGNHTIAERMFRYDPAVMLYAPLHTAIWASADGAARFSFDRPSDQFSSFGNAAVAEVGFELDRKLAALLEHLQIAVPDSLLVS
jgi:hypothetical protein